MFKKFFSKKNKDTEQFSGADILIAALLIHAAKIDENYTELEKEIIKKALISLTGAQKTDVVKLLTKAKEKEKESNQIY